MDTAVALEVRSLSLGYGDHVVLQNLSFSVPRRSIFAIMGGSGCGKSTLLHSLIGLLRPSAGAVLFRGEDFWTLDAAGRGRMGRRFGVLFQQGALWSTLTAAQNVALPLQLFTTLDAASIDELVQLKLSLVGLTEGRSQLPSELSGGMAKRVGLARANALEPDILFLDEPSAGLDPVSAQRLDHLILELRDGFGVTIVLVSHELPSLFAICDDGIFLDAATHTAIARGGPRELRDGCVDPTVHAFLHREEPGP
jgi:phospholipid/cholesterol/gamma-HCH transport system ATP-binding protein